MEFSRIADGNVYIKGNEREKSVILLMMHGFIQEHEIDIGTITDYMPSQIAKITIASSNDLLIISVDDFKAMYSCFVGMLNFGYFGEDPLMSEEEFVKTFTCLDGIAKRIIAIVSSD